MVLRRLVGIEREGRREILRPAVRPCVAAPQASGVAGPLTVAQLFRVVLCFLGVSGRPRFAMGLLVRYLVHSRDR